MTDKQAFKTVHRTHVMYTAHTFPILMKGYKCNNK